MPDIVSKEELKTKIMSSVREQIKAMESNQGFPFPESMQHVGFLNITTGEKIRNSRKSSSTRIYVHVMPLIGKTHETEKTFNTLLPFTDELLNEIKAELVSLKLFPNNQNVPPELARDYALLMNEKLEHDFPDIFGKQPNANRKASFTISMSLRPGRSTELKLEIAPFVTQSAMEQSYQPPPFMINCVPFTSSHKASQQFAESLKQALETQDYIHRVNPTLSPRKAADRLIPEDWLLDKAKLFGNEQSGYSAVLTREKALVSKIVKTNLNTFNLEKARELLDNVDDYITQKKSAGEPFSLNMLHKAVIPEQRHPSTTRKKVEPTIILAKGVTGETKPFIKLMVPNILNNSVGKIRVAPAVQSPVDVMTKTFQLFPSEALSKDEAIKQVAILNDLSAITLQQKIGVLQNPQLMITEIKPGNYFFTKIDNYKPRPFTFQQLGEKTEALLKADAANWEHADNELIKFARSLKQTLEELQLLTPTAEQISQAWDTIANGAAYHDTTTLAVAGAVDQFQQDSPYYTFQIEGNTAVGIQFNNEQYLNAGWFQEALEGIDMRARALSFRFETSPHGQDENGSQDIAIQAMRNFKPLNLTSSEPEKDLWVEALQKEKGILLPWDDLLMFTAPDKASAEAFKQTVLEHLYFDPLTGKDRPVEQFGVTSMNLVLRESIHAGLNTVPDVQIDSASAQAFQDTFPPKQKPHASFVDKAQKSPGGNFIAL